MKDDLISRQALLKIIPPEETCSRFAVANAPTVEPQRKTGQWIHIRTEEDGNALYTCSECHMGEVHVPIVEVKYCWNCGAKMEVET